MTTSNYIPGIGAWASKYMHLIMSADCQVAIANWEASSKMTEMVCGEKGILLKEAGSIRQSGHDEATNLILDGCGSIASAGLSLGFQVAGAVKNNWSNKDVISDCSQKKGTLQANREAVELVRLQSGSDAGTSAGSGAHQLSSENFEHFQNKSYNERPISDEDMGMIRQMSQNQQEIVIKRIDDQIADVDKVLNTVSNKQQINASTFSTLGRSLGDATTGVFKLVEAGYVEDKAKEDAKRQIFATINGIITNQVIANMSQVAKANEEAMSATAQALAGLMDATHRG